MDVIHKQGTATPLCKVFGECGGCQYQDLNYSDELSRKETELRAGLRQKLDVPNEAFSPIVPSPREYHYRNRLDMKLLRIRSGEVFVGFSPVDQNRVVLVEDCPIAMEPIARYLPRLKPEASAKLTAKHRNANLVVRTGDDGRVFWGGVGRRSLRQEPQDYLWTEINGKRIFYSLDTFFQANLSILPELLDRIRSLGVVDSETIFYDLYGGVGLFGICLQDLARKVILIEESVHSIVLAKHNVDFHQSKNFEIVAGRVEDRLPEFLARETEQRQVAMIDPPRQGLSESVRQMLNGSRGLSHLLYLSCHPESLARDLADLCSSAWKIAKIIPFDFFPKTRHLETLVLLKNVKRCA